MTTFKVGDKVERKTWSMFFNVYFTLPGEVVEVKNNPDDRDEVVISWDNGRVKDTYTLASIEALSIVKMGTAV